MRFCAYFARVKVRPFGAKFRADAGNINGRRVTRVFERVKDAERWLDQQEKIRRDSKLGIRRISQGREQLAAIAFEQLEKHGLKDDALLDAVRRFCSIASPAKKTGLKEALASFERDLNFGNRSPVYVDQIGRQLTRFYRDFPDKQLHEFDGDSIREWLEANCETAGNRSNRRRELKVFFSWAKKQGLISENPVDRVPGIAVHKGKPEILKIPQVKSAMENLDGRDRALFAIMTFTGLRPSEAQVIHWEDIKLDRGFLVATRGFGADNRNVVLSDNLVSWLRPLQGTGQVYKGDDRKWRRRVKAAIAKSKIKIEEWPQDLLRHTFGSYHLEKHKDAPGTAYEMGHRGNPKMLYAHYRDLVTPEDAEAFWKIIPEK
jgi:integrase